MTRAGLDKNRILQNLSDAGCKEEEINRIMQAIDDHDYKKLDSLIEDHRKQLLDQYHNSKQCIDCIDYFIYQFKKSLEGMNEKI